MRHPLCDPPDLAQAGNGRINTEDMFNWPHAIKMKCSRKALRYLSGQIECISMEHGNEMLLLVSYFSSDP